MKYQCEHSDTGIYLKCMKHDQINKAYDLLREIYAPLKTYTSFDVATQDTEGNDVMVTCETKKLLEIINLMDIMLGR